MNISYHWLKEYIDLDLSPEQVAEHLTMLGLEVGKIDRKGAIPGNLAGVLVGKVLRTEQHPNADRLRICQVDIGAGEPLSIVCGAANVAEGQKVPVATIGTKLYPFGQGEEAAFTIKKGKIRGEVSEGMICAEDELGIGPGHEGILVLDASAPVGAEARDFLAIKEDIVLEVDLTPNRVDAASHYGVARDLAAALGQVVKFPVLSFDPSTLSAPQPIHVKVEDPLRCKRYTSLCIDGVSIGESPEWLQERLTSIGLRPINNVVDVTNYVLHELGQPLHAFDADRLEGGQIIVKTLPEAATLVTLDEQSRALLPDQDLLICDAQRPLCLAGIMGGLHSGVSSQTTRIFLESAYFDAGSVRRTSKRLGINTDSSFRFERGADPHMTLRAALRAADLIQQLAGGEISVVTDWQAEAFAPFLVNLSVRKTQRLIGAAIAKEEIIRILTALEITVSEQDEDLLALQVPPYRVDVKRDVDVIEDLLRVYGYNRIALPAQMHSSLDYRQRRNDFRLKETVANYFSANGYYEILNNSLVSKALGDDQAVELANPLSEDLGIMRQSMLPGALETVRYNQNRQQESLKFFEFGKTYRKRSEMDFEERSWMAITVAGLKHPMHWEAKAPASTLFTLTHEVERLQAWAGISGQVRECEDPEFAYALELVVDGRVLLRYGRVTPQWESRFDLRMETYHLRLDWEGFLKAYGSKVIRYQPVSVFPAVRRDISLLMEQNIDFAKIREVVLKANPKLIQSVALHDVYRGKGMAESEKSYLISIELRDDTKTLLDDSVEKVMSFVVQSLEKQLGVKVRGKS